ncbi:2OG-Fe dioxygenase family protein [Sphingomonas sp. AP4-R1]|nr:2OG-Fe dioxygenase family protein [Sphingomonas sp. AP4-R1]
MDGIDELQPLSRLSGALADKGYVHLDARDFRSLAGAQDPAEFASFAAMWSDMPLDDHMADGGRYRRRRHAAFRAQGGGLIRKPHQAHFQSKDHNPLNGDRQRWFAPVHDAFVAHPIAQRLFALCTPLFASIEGGYPARCWDVELHQFRIEARGGALGLPTPEGMHRDGVDWVLVMLTGRTNVDAGTTRIIDEAGRRDSFTLTEPGEAVLLDDRRIRHGVTAIRALDPALPAHRDVLVVTWRAA